MPAEGRRRMLADRTDAARVEARRRRAEATWSEWFHDEFLRYLYALGVLAVLLFVPLQMVETWLPREGPPLLSPAFVCVLGSVFDAAVLFLGAYGYLFLWRNDGFIERLFVRPEDRGK